MKAIIQNKYGSPDVLELARVKKPEPAEDQLLIKVKASSVNALDWHMMRADPFIIRLTAGLLTPKAKTLGADIAGVVEAVGSQISEFKVGDEVFGACGSGGFAEYVCAREKNIVLKPANVTFEQAAAVPVAAITALQGLRKAGAILPGQKVMIHGASGGVGTFAVQIAKARGAEVTAVNSTRNIEMVRQIGADHVIDYTQEDFVKNGQRYDLIFGVNGNRSIFDYKEALAPRGNFVLAGGSGYRQMLQTMLLGKWLSEENGRQIMSMGIAQIVKEDLLILKEMLESGQIKPVIDKCYPLPEAADAVRYVEDVHAKGKVVISVA